MRRGNQRNVLFVLPVWQNPRILTERTQDATQPPNQAQQGQRPAQKAPPPPSGQPFVQSRKTGSRPSRHKHVHGARSRQGLRLGCAGIGVACPYARALVDLGPRKRTLPSSKRTI